MQKKSLLLPGFILLCFFTSCTKNSTSLFQRNNSNDTALDAKMAVYGFKPYTGPLDSVVGVKPITFDQFVAKMTLVNQAFKQHLQSKQIKMESSTNGAYVDTTQDYIEDQEDTTYFWTDESPLNLTFYYPSILAPLGFPYVYTLTLQNMSGTVITNTLSTPGGSFNGSYRFLDGENNSDGFDYPSYVVDGYLYLYVAFTNSNGGLTYYTIEYYVTNYINGNNVGANEFDLSSQIYLTKAD